jgi:subtilisin family serine protease
LIAGREAAGARITSVQLFSTHKMKNLIVCAIASVLILSVFVAVSSGASGDANLKIEQKVLEKASENGEIRVIVLLKDSSKSKRKGIMTEAKSRISSEKIKNEFQSINGFSASLSLRDIEELEKDENVEGIYYDKPVSVFLDESVPLINATESWKLQDSGINLTGKGQTVCIIDTGVDYTHPDLGNCTPARYELGGSVENLTTAVESAHNYENDFDYTWTITKAGYLQIAVHFVNISLEYPGQGGEDSGDRVIIYNSQMKEIARYHGINGVITDLWTPYSDGDTIYIRLVTDVSVTSYGFYINQVRNGTTNTTYDWRGCSKVIGGWDFVNNEGDPKDDYGHGTHVAGIVAANGVKKGVAPEAKIVAAKALDASGSGYTSDVAAGIEWCTNRSEDFNISVISMSIGEGLYSDYCDANSPLLASAINAAVAKNISVIVASGNGLNNDGIGRIGEITSPACIANAIPVGATNKSDIIAPYSNRNNWTIQLFAPGSGIISTKNGGGYISMDGTSMATPHVAGAFAVINQFLELQNVKKTPQEIEAVFNATGKQISDPSSGLNFSRINIYDAIIALDAESPEINLISPSAKYIDNSADSLNLTFRCNASDLSLKNMTFYVWNETEVYNSSFYDVSGTNATLEMSLTNIPLGEYSWNCIAYDANGNSAFAPANYSIAYDSTTPEVTLRSPDNGSSGTNNLISFDFNVSDEINLANCSLVINDAFSAVNSSSISRSSVNSISQSLSVGNYTWSINCMDRAGNTGNSSTRSLEIAAAPPEEPHGGGGGGGGATYSTFAASGSEMTAGYTEGLIKNDRINFNDRDGQNHTLTLNYVGTDFVTLVIRSAPIYINLSLGQEKKLNLSSKDYYDLLVKLDGIAGGKATVTIKEIYEAMFAAKPEIKTNEIPVPQETQPAPGKAAPEEDNRFNADALNEKEGKSWRDWMDWIVAVMVFAVILAFVVYLIVRAKPERTTRHISHKLR